MRLSGHLMMGINTHKHEEVKNFFSISKRFFSGPAAPSIAGMARIFLCTDGSTVTGPFTLTQLRRMLSQYEVAKTTMACREGAEQWIPLGDVEPRIFERPATAKQKALLSYLGYDTEDVSLEEATFLIDQEKETVTGEEKLHRWITDRLTLHPDLYKDEIEAAAAAKKEARKERPQTICQQCNDWGDEYGFLDGSYWPLKKLRIRQCQAAVKWLDDSQPGWDEKLYDADGYGLNQDLIESVFFPALGHVAPDAFRKRR